MHRNHTSQLLGKVTIGPYLFHEIPTTLPLLVQILPNFTRDQVLSGLMGTNGNKF